MIRRNAMWLDLHVKTQVAPQYSVVEWLTCIATLYETEYDCNILYI